MKCPVCGGEMLDSPPFDRDRKVMQYWLCMNCTPNIRIVKKCKWMASATIHGMNDTGSLAWCIHPKLNSFCCAYTDPDTDYIFCPQIREWQEKACAFIATKNREIEKKMKKEREEYLKKCKEIFNATQKSA